MINIRNITKTFNTPFGKVDVLKDVSLNIEKGDIFGIIGFSGAGKSTLIRCLNCLELPDDGEVYIENKEISSLSNKELRKARKKIGMIFQQFNLLDSRTVFENIAFPLEIAKYPKNKIKDRVEELLKLVELTDKRNAYPAQLSGGQKQRVGIARALANDPDVLLSDEATSALDPQTTYSILTLLKDINKKLGLTIILITHELEVIKYCCNNVAVLEDGKIIENRDVESFFANPTSDTAKLFLNITKQLQNCTVTVGGDGI